MNPPTTTNVANLALETLSAWVCISLPELRAALAGIPAHACQCMDGPPVLHYRLSDLPSAIRERVLEHLRRNNPALYEKFTAPPAVAVASGPAVGQLYLTGFAAKAAFKQPVAA